MSRIDPTDDGGAAIRQERTNQAAAARRLVKEAKKASDDGHNTDGQRYSAFGRLLSWLRRSRPGS